MVYPHDNRLKIRLVYEVGIEDYFYFRQLCRNYFPDMPEPQPANHWYSDWYTFAVGGGLMYGYDETSRELNLSKEKHYLAFVEYITNRYIQMNPNHADYEREVYKIFGGHIAK